METEFVSIAELEDVELVHILAMVMREMERRWPDTFKASREQVRASGLARQFPFQQHITDVVMKAIPAEGKA